MNIGPISLGGTGRPLAGHRTGSGHALQRSRAKDVPRHLVAA